MDQQNTDKSTVEGVSDVPQRIQEIKERRAKITVALKPDLQFEHVRMVGECGQTFHDCCSVASVFEHANRSQKDFVLFFANAPQDIDYLLARVAELEAAIGNAELNAQRQSEDALMTELELAAELERNGQQ